MNSPPPIPLAPCPHCRTPLFRKVTWWDEVTSSAHVVEASGVLHSTEQCRDRLITLLNGAEAALSVASDRLARAGNPR